MTTNRQAKQQIRFSLDQLSAKNGHHEFEHLCENLARRTVCSNILPATGPVSAGGDQGRDFETFRTYLSTCSSLDSAFLGRTSDGPIVFACTLTRDKNNKLQNKIRNDVRAIMEPEYPVDAIYVYLANDLEVSKRHKLQSWAKTEFNLHLEIHDAQAISISLCEPELFWIAVEYLDISRDLQPQRTPEDVDDWYKTALERWSTNDLEYYPIQALFYELVSGVRHATFESTLRSDVPLWVSRLEEFRDKDNCSENLKRKATYEIAVACFRGLGTMRGREDELREYFDKISELESPVDFEDVSALLSYIYGAYHANAVQLLPSEIDSYQDIILDTLKIRLANSETATSKCAFLELVSFSILRSGPVEKPVYPDFEQVFKYWDNLLDLVSGAPLYPLERFADRISELITLIGEPIDFEQITQRIDVLLSTRFGGFIAAEKCRDRALKYYDQGRVLRAIRELHRAKIAWFKDETLSAALLAMLLLSQWYRELGLSYAAKQYALGVAFISGNTSKGELKQYLPVSYVHASHSDYIQGCWFDYLGLADTAMRSHNLIPNQEYDVEAVDVELEEITFHTSIIIMTAEKLSTEFIPSINSITSEWPINNLLDKSIPMARDAWADKNIDQLWRDFEKKLCGRPFSDIGNIRTVTWMQLGVTWEVDWDNNYNLTALGEQFIATAQILMAEWAGIDLCFLRTRVHVDISVADIEKPEVTPKPSNKGRLWQLLLPSSRKGDYYNDLQQDTLVCVMTILNEISLLPYGEFMQRAEESFKDGLNAKVTVARSYEELFRSCISPYIFSNHDRSSWELPEKTRLFKVDEHKDMSWFNGPGPGYNLEENELLIRRRYKKAILPIQHTFKRLVLDKIFMETVALLQKEGWLDWHFLIAIMNITINYRVNNSLNIRQLSDQEISELYNSIMNKEECKDALMVPIEEFSENNLRYALSMSKMSTLGNNGLDLQQRTPDLDAIDDFLRYRYNYWTDDVDHESIFSEID